jgi:predicted methyltransferase
MKPSEEMIYATVSILVMIYRKSNRSISLKDLYLILKREMHCSVQESLKIVHVLKDYNYVEIEDGICKVTDKGGEAARSVMVHM